MACTFSSLAAVAIASLALGLAQPDVFSVVGEMILNDVSAPARRQD